MLTLPSSSARRLKNYIGTQVAWSKITSRITQDDPDTVIAFGDASFNHASKGHHATPNVRAKKEFAKKARVRLTNEHRTSVACSAPSCPEESMHEPGAQTEHWQVKCCRGCHQQWNRDVNAARNILACFLYMQLHAGARPPKLAHRPRGPALPASDDDAPAAAAAQQQPMA
jgi:hypothetical protein